MRIIGRSRLAAGVVALLAVAGAGGAIAATTGGSPAEESKAIVDDAAEALGVTPAQLTDALESALAKRIDAAVAGGRLTEEQGAELKERIASGDDPLVGVHGPGFGRGGPGFGHGPGVGLDAAAGYLGVTESELRDRLHAGDTLADLAAGQGKPVDGLVDALVAAAKERLAQAQEAGRLDADRRAELEATLGQRIRELVNGERSARSFRGPGPPPGDDAPGPPNEDTAA